MVGVLCATESKITADGLKLLQQQEVVEQLRKKL